MFNFLQDTVWQFLIGASIAIIAIVVSVILYFKQLNRKRLSYEILSDTSLLTTDEETKNEIRLTYKNEPIEKVRLIVLRIFNSGNVPVESEDYEEPISIRLGDARVLSAEVIKKSPKNLKSTLIIEKGVVTLYPTLLNPADSLKIKILVSDYEKGLGAKRGYCHR